MCYTKILIILFKRIKSTNDFYIPGTCGIFVMYQRSPTFVLCLTLAAFIANTYRGDVPALDRIVLRFAAGRIFVLVFNLFLVLVATVIRRVVSR